MSQAMTYGAERPLTAAEWAGLSPGLADALRAAGVEPVIVARPCKLARIARLWRGGVPIMALGRTIYWAGATDDLAGPWNARAMAILQHELQHLLEYATGELGVVRYGANPRNWTYGYTLTAASQWSDFGAEQRASIVEHLWLIEHRLMVDAAGGAHHRRVIPWVG